MSDTIATPDTAYDVSTLARNLRMAADELESAARWGLDIPHHANLSGHRLLGGLSLVMDSGTQFDEWAAYTEAEVEDYTHADHHWSRARANVNGLLVEFFVKRGPVAL